MDTMSGNKIKETLFPEICYSQPSLCHSSLYLTSQPGSFRAIVATPWDDVQKQRQPSCGCAPCAHHRPCHLTLLGSALFCPTPTVSNENKRDGCSLLRPWTSSTEKHPFISKWNSASNWTYSTFLLISWPLYFILEYTWIKPWVQFCNCLRIQITTYPLRFTSTSWFVPRKL